jgi:hypothetical protein
LRSDVRLGPPLLAALACACSGSVHDTSVASTPLVVVHGRVDRAALERPHPEAPLVGAIFWAGMPSVNPVCLLYDDRPELADVCPDPYGVFLAGPSPAVPVAADGSFALALDTLPDARLSVGDAAARITYGTLVVVEDVDGDGAAHPFARKRGADTLVAAAFHHLRAPQARVVLREGGFVEGSLYYPAPGCAPPPPGFSVLTAPPYADGAAPAGGGCAVRDIGDPVEVPPLSPELARAFVCREAGIPPDRELIHRSSDMIPPLPDTTAVCLGRDLVAITAKPGAGISCPVLLTFALKGCFEDPVCAVPEWDDSARPPAWWPCH